MRIELQEKYKLVIFQEQPDSEKVKESGQKLLDELLSVFKNQNNYDVNMQENEFFCKPKFTENELLFIEKLKQKNDQHIFRYAKIDFLFWYEFMNHIDDVLLKFTQYFDQFTVKPLQKHTNQSQFDIDPVPSDQTQCLDKDSLEKQRHLKLQMGGLEIVQALDQMQIVLISLFDIINCERCTNIGYFSVCDRILALLKQMFLLKLIGIEKYTTTIVDLLDSLIVFCASAKANLLYGYNEININALILGILIPFTKTFYGLSRQILSADSPEKQAILSQQKIESHQACGFITLPSLEYSISHAFDLSGTLIQLYMNYGLPTSCELGTHNSTQFEESVPPQQTFETLTEIIQSQVLDKRIKIVTINVMHKLIQLDMVARFGYSSAKQNPYFNEAIKYSSLYAEIFNQLSNYHCTLKPSYRTNEQIDPFEQSLNKKYFQYQETDRVIEVTKDTWIESQNFLNDFINFLSNIAKVRLKHVNSAIFPQITGQIIKIISQPYDVENQCYPINLNVQGVACRLLTDSLRQIQTFDDSEQLNMLIQKLRQEITIIKIQSQTQVVHKLDGFYFGESEHEGYLRLYEKSWPNDDDYLCKYQTLIQRHLLIKQLLRLLCICIRRNDPNLVSYNQNYVPHSRKILESSVIQDDILTNIFKIHETLRSQEDLAYKNQVEATVSSLIIPCIQLITQVFNDLPSKIGTFSQNGLFHSVISSLTNGGIPTAPNMLLILGQFMQMLTLNSDTKQLLASSELVSMFFRMCTDPKKYYKFITSRRRDDIQYEQVILAVANANEIICEKIFKEFFEISNMIIQRSGELTRDYISMDQKLKLLDQKLVPFKQQYIYSAQFEEMSEQIEKEKNEIRQSYLQKQLSLENMFDSFYLQFISLFDNERNDNSVGGISFSDPVNTWIAKNKDEVIQLIYRSAQNPVLASALHQYSEEYTSLVIALLNIIKAHQQQTFPNNFQHQQNAPQIFMNKIFTNLKIQIENLKQILRQDGSSLLELGFKDFPDIESQKTFKMNMVEQPEYYENFPELKQFAEEINGDCGISPQDQIAIILRKIFLYCETIMYWLQSFRDPKRKYNEFIKLFEQQITQSLPDIAKDLFQLSTLITKNRAVNYAKTVFEENQKLEKYYQQFTEEKIKQENEQMRAASAEGSAQSPVTNELQAAARLYEKYERQKGSDTLTKHIHELADTASVMNFKCDDSICTNGQACQIQAKRLLKWLPLSIRGRKAPGPRLPTWYPTHEIMIQTSRVLGQEQLAECIDFIEAAENFIQKFQKSEHTHFDIHFDQVLFNLISGLYQTNKVICNGNLPGSFVYSFANAVLDSNFLTRLIRVSVLLADFIEANLRKGIKIPFFRLAYIKVLWKNVHSLIQTLLDTNFCPTNESDKAEFLIEFDRCYSFQNQEFTEFINRLRDGNKQEMIRAVIQIAERGRCNLQSLWRKIFLQIGQAFYQQQLNGELLCEDLKSSSNEYFNIFYFLSKYTQKCCLSQLSSFLLNHLTNDFSKLQLNKKMGATINNTLRSFSNLDHYLNRIPNIQPILDYRSLNHLQYAPHRRAIEEVLALQENAEQRQPPQPPESRASSSQDSSFSESIGEDQQFIPVPDMVHMGNFGPNDRFQVFIGSGDQQGINFNSLMQIDNQTQLKQELLPEESNLFKDLIEKLNQQSEKIKENCNKDELIQILQTQITDSNKLILHSLLKKSEILLAETFQEHEHYKNVCKLLSDEEKQSQEKMGKQLKQIISQLIANQLKIEIDKITPQTIPNFKLIINNLLVCSLSMLIQDKPIYGNYYWDKQKNEVYGINLRLDLSYALISKMLRQAGVHEGLSFIGSKNNKNEVIENQDHFKFLKERIEMIFIDFLDSKSNYLQRANLMDINQLRQVVMGIFTFKKYSLIYSNEWNQPRKQLYLFSNILKKATKALQKCFNHIPELQKQLLTLKAQMNTNKKDSAQYQEKMKSFEEQESVILREQNEIENIRLPLLNTLLMIAEEQLTYLLSPSLLDAKVNEIVQVAESIRDTPEMDQARVTPPSEETVRAKIQCLEKFQQSLLNIFKDQQDIFKDDTSGKPKQAIIKDTLESLLKQQIELLKVYGNTPIEACVASENKTKNQESELKTFLPVVLAIRLLKIIICLGDQLLKLDNKHIKQIVKPGQQSKPINQQVFLCPLRRLFMQNDGLRHMFLIKVQELYCYQPDQFYSKKVQGFIHFRQQYEGVVDELVATLGSTPSSYIRIFESQIKQLMFVQFKQNFYKENKKEALEVFRNLLSITASKDQNQDQSEVQQNNQKALQTKQKESKKQKQNTQEGQAGHSKHQQKQIKILLRKHENQSEVPLRQFIEFFILSKLLQPNIEDELGLFLTACKNMCLINVVDSQESDCQKIVTIKLKTNVLKEVILDGIQLNNQVSQKSKNQKAVQNTSDTWNSQFQKQVGEVQFQHEIVTQLLDLFIFQNKGHKMSFLKQLKAGKLNETSNQIDEYQVKLIHNQIYIKPSEQTVFEENEIVASEKCEYLFDSQQILQNISIETSKSPILVGSVLSHQQQKTFKYIVRNCISLKLLQSIPEETKPKSQLLKPNQVAEAAFKKIGGQKIVFKENEKVLDTRIHNFFRTMLFDRHTVQASKKIFRLEARNVFIQEMTKNLITHQQISCPDENNKDQLLSVKLIQNYNSILLIHHVLFAPDSKTDKLAEKWKAINQKIRRYNKTQQWNIMLRIIFEIQRNCAISFKEGIESLGIFKILKRIRDELTSPTLNPFIEYKARAIAICNSLVIRISKDLIKDNEKNLIKQINMAMLPNADTAEEKGVEPTKKRINERRWKNKSEALDDGSMLRSQEDEYIDDEGDEQEEEEYDEEFEEDMDGTFQDEEGEEEHDEEDDDILLEQAVQNNLEMEQDFEEGEAEMDEDEVNDITNEAERQRVIRLLDIQMQSEQSDEEDQNSGPPSEEGSNDQMDDEDMFEEYNGDDPEEEDGLDDIDRSEDEEDEDSLIAGSYDDNGQEFNDEEDAYSMADGVWPQGNVYPGEGAGENDLFDQNIRRLPEQNSDYQSSQKSYSSNKQDQLQDFAVDMLGTQEERDFLANFGIGRTSYRFMTDIYRSSLPLFAQRINLQHERTSAQSNWHQNVRAMWWNNQDMQQQTSATSDALLAQAQKILSGESKGEDEKQFLQWIIKRQFSFEKILCKVKGGCESDLQALQKMKEDQQNQVTDFETIILKLESTLKDLCIFGQNRQFCLAFQSQLLASIVALYDIISMQIGTDQNLFVCSISTDCDELKALQLSLVDRPSIKIQMIQPHPTQNEQNPNTNSKELKQKQEETITLNHLVGYNEFLTTLKVLNGEIFEEESKAQTRENEEGQIDSSAKITDLKPSLDKIYSTLNQLDPLFTQALNEPSISSIIESDRRIHQMQKRTDQTQQNLPQANMNQFIKKQTIQIRQQILKSLDAHFLQYLDPDLYAEALKLRPNKQQQERALRGRQNNNQNVGALRSRGNVLQINQNQVRERLLSMDVYQSRPVLEIENVNNRKQNNQEGEEAKAVSALRDSESEDINIQAGNRYNLNQDAFCSNLHEFMTQNIENYKDMQIKNFLKQEWIQSRKLSKNKLKQIDTNRDLEVFIEEILINQFIPSTSDGVQDFTESSKKLQDLIDLALSEIMTSKAILSMEEINSTSHFKRLSFLMQLPHFRLILQVKLVNLMQSNVEYIKQKIEKNQKIEEGQLQIWESEFDVKPKDLSPKLALSFLIKYIYEIQQSTCSRSGKKGVLDLLKIPSQDPFFQSLVQDDGDKTLLDRMLVALNEYIQILNENPLSFDLKENSQKEFSRWKKEVLQLILLLLDQFYLSTSHIVRRLSQQGTSPYQQTHSFSMFTLQQLFKILFFSSKDLIDSDALNVDNQQSSVSQIIKVLNRISTLKIESSIQADLNDNTNLLSFKKNSVKKDDGEEFTVISAADLVRREMKKLINIYLEHFHDLFDQKLQIVSKSQSSVLSASQQKSEKKRTFQVVSKIQHIFKIALSLSCIKNTKVDSGLLFDQLQLCKLLSVVQRIIDHEKNLKKQQVCQNQNEMQVAENLQNNNLNSDQHGDAQNQESSSVVHWQFLLKEEFKLILNLVLTLAYQQLKQTKLSEASSIKPIVQSEPNQQPEQDEQNIQILGRRQRANQKKKQTEVQVLFESAEEIKNQKSRDDKFLSQNPVYHNFEDNSQTHQLLDFIMLNKELLNVYIQKSHSNQQNAQLTSLLDLVIMVPQILEFSSKRILWRQCIKKQLKKQGRDEEYEIEVQVRRGQVFQDSFEQLKDVQIDSWKQKFSVEFHDEEGVDEGGLTKEWFQLVSQGIFDPNYALFQQSAQGSTYFPSPKSVVHEKEELAQLFVFVGRIIGKALCEGHLLDCYFVKALYKMMLGQKLELSDLEDFDPQVYKSLQYMLNNDAETLCQSFLLSSKFFDEQKNIELKTGGSEIEVTNQNKFEYCQLVLEYLLYGCVRSQIDSLLKGFRDLVPQNLVQMFDNKELELMLSGMPVIDIQDLKENVIYRNFTRHTPVIIWLWEILEEFKNSERAEFIQFVTATSKVPVEGFKGLRGSSGQSVKVEIIKLTCDQPDQRLPQAHTCFFQLDLPEYSSKQILRQKLLFAIKEGKTFNIA